MILSRDYLLKDVLGTPALIPVGRAIDEGACIVKLNESGHIMAELLQNDISYKTFMDELIKEFEVEENEKERFAEMVNVFLETLKKKTILTNL